jgi:diguanylate cyclase (GGDEF)-like protein
VRTFDTVSRWGGEEYVAVISNVEGNELLATANRCRVIVEQSSLPGVQPVQVAVSLGATLARREDSVTSIIKRADQLMYVSKQAGRNRVTSGL